MGLRFDPVGGGQFKQAVQQIIEAERQPLKAIEARKKTEEAKLKLLQEFKAKFTGFDKTLSEFTDFRKFRELKVDLGDGSGLMSVTLDKDRAQPGNYSVQIEQLAARSSIISNGFENPNEPVLGSGFVGVTLKNGETVEIYVDEENGSLHGVANTINRQDGSPIRASVIKDLSNQEYPWKLVIAGKKDGSDDQVAFPEFYFMDGYEEIYIDDEHDAQNAIIHLDGFPIEAESNEISDFLQGVNVQLKQAKPEQPFTLAITQDYQKISGKLKGLVDQINSVLEFINKQNQVDEKTDTRNTFSGDTSLQTIEYRLRNLLHEGFPVALPGNEGYRFLFLNQLGVQFEKSGSLSFKEDKFTQLLEKDFEGISEAITGEFGLAAQLRDVVAGYTATGNGLLAIKEQGLRSRVQKLDRDIAEKERRVDQKARAVTEQFSRLQSTIGNMQRQQQYLSAALPSGGGGGNLMSALMGG